MGSTPLLWLVILYNFCEGFSTGCRGEFDGRVDDKWRKCGTI